MLPAYIDVLVTSGAKLVNQIKEMWNIVKELNRVDDETEQPLSDKLKILLDKNYGHNALKNVAHVLTNNLSVNLMS